MHPVDQVPSTQTAFQAMAHVHSKIQFCAPWLHDLSSLFLHCCCSAVHTLIQCKVFKNTDSGQVWAIIISYQRVVKTVKVLSKPEPARSRIILHLSDVLEGGLSLTF